jgi:predicted DNA binding CopG/RHH family protein
MEQAKESATRAISIRIPVADLERAQRIAGQTGVGYQTVLKRAIREGLEKAAPPQAVPAYAPSRRPRAVP